MRFQVPQFIEVEDKIFGPLTFKQFIYVGGGVGACVVFFTFLPTFLAIILSVPVAVLAAALAFFKVNEKPFINTIEAFVRYSIGGKLYLWKKAQAKPATQRAEPARITPEQVHIPKLSESKLKELTWSLDIKENQNPVTESNNSRL